MTTRKNKFLWKRSNVPGKIPSPTDLILGEMALNTADVKLYTSGTTANAILPIGWDRISRTGDTMSGTLYSPSFSATTFSGGTYYGDGSNLTGIVSTDTYLTGGTLTSNGLLNLNLNNASPDVNVDLTDTKRLLLSANEGYDINSGLAYFTNSGAVYFTFGGNNNSNDVASWNFLVPTDYVSGGTFYIKFMTQATTNNIQFEMNVTSIDNGGDASIPTDTALLSVTQGSSTDWALVVTNSIDPVNSTFTKNKNVSIRINRDASDVNDTYGGTAYVWGLVFEYIGII